MRFSEDYVRYSTKLLTFSGIALSLKVIPLEAVTFSDVTITLTSRPIAIGLICFFVLYLLINYAVLWLRDFGEQKLRDSALFEAASVNSTEVNLELTPLPEVRLAGWNLFLARLHIGLDSIVPALFAFFVVVLCRNDLLTFLQHLWGVIEAGFSLATLHL